MKEIDYSFSSREPFPSCSVSRIPLPHEIYHEVFDAIWKIENPVERAECFAHWVEHVGLSNEEEFGIFVKYRTGLFKDALDCIDAVPDLNDRDTAYQKIMQKFISYTECDEYHTSILVLAEEKGLIQSRNRFLCKIAFKKLRKGSDISEILTVLKNVDSQSDDYGFFQEILVSHWIESNDIQSALDTAKQIVHKMRKIDVFTDIARSKCLKKESNSSLTVSLARETSQLVRDALNEPDLGDRKNNHVLNELTNLLCGIGMTTEAFAMMDVSQFFNRFPYLVETILWKTFEKCGKNQFEQMVQPLLEFANKQADSEKKCRFLLCLANVYARTEAKDMETALRTKVLDFASDDSKVSSEELVERSNVLRAIAENLHANKKYSPALVMFQKALRISESISAPDLRAKQIAAIAKSLAEDSYLHEVISVFRSHINDPLVVSEAFTQTGFELNDYFREMPEEDEKSWGQVQMETLFCAILHSMRATVDPLRKAEFLQYYHMIVD